MQNRLVQTYIERLEAAAESMDAATASQFSLVLSSLMPIEVSLAVVRVSGKQPFAFKSQTPDLSINLKACLIAALSALFHPGRKEEAVQPHFRIERQDQGH